MRFFKAGGCQEQGKELLPPWDAVERSHEQVSDGEVEQEVVGDAPHGLVRQDDPQDHRVAQNGDDDDHWEEEGPDDLLKTPRVFLKIPANL